MKIEMVSLIFLLLVGFFDLIQIGLCCPSFSDLRHHRLSQMQIASDVPLWTQQTYGHVPART
jgi:hypothetical protein